MDALQNVDAVLHHSEVDGQYFTKFNLKLYQFVCHTLILH